MDSKAQRVFFENTPKLCVWHTEVTNCYNFKFGTSFSVPKWGVLANRLNNQRIREQGLCTFSIYDLRRSLRCEAWMRIKMTLHIEEGKNNVVIPALN